MTNAPLVFSYAINRQVRNKTKNHELLTSSFRDETGTLETLKDLLTVEGHAFCVCLLGNRRRLIENFAGSWFVGIDIDNSKPLLDASGKQVKDDEGHVIKVFDHQMTIEEALAHPFVREYCWLGYTTASHTESWHRFRLMCRLPEYIKDAALHTEIIQLVAAQVPHDKACLDEARVFFGNDEAQVILFNPDAKLPDYTAEAQQRVAATKAAAALQAQQQAQRQLRQQQADPQDEDERIAQALSFIPPRAPGTGTYEMYRGIFQALVLHYGPARALPIIEQHSPFVKPKNGKNGHSGWNPRQFVWNVRPGNRPATLASLFFHAKKHGYERPKPEWAKPEWQGPSPEEWAAQLAWEAEQERVEAGQAALDADLWFVENIRSVIKQLSRRVSQGFAKVTSRPPKPEPEVPETVVYEPGCIPFFVKGLKLPCYEYPASGKLDKEEAIAEDAAMLKQLLTEASAKGWRDPHDSSATGTGKTATWCGLDAEARVFYVSPMRAVTDAARAKFVPIVVRHNGNLIPDGKGGSRWAKPGDDPVGGGNCHLASTFHKLQHKGVTVVSAKAKQNPVCLSCVNAPDCGDPKSAGANDGSGYRAAQATLLSTQRWIRGTAASLPLFVGADHGKTDWLLSGAQSRDEAEALETAPVPDADKRYVYVDEAGQVLQQNIVQTITASQSDMAKGLYRLESIAPEFHALLTTFWQKLHKLSDAPSRFGVDEAALLKELPEPTDAWREAFLAVRPSLIYNLSDDLESEDDDPETSARWEAVTKRLSSLEGKLASRERKLTRLNDELTALEHYEPLTPAQLDRLTKVERLKHKCLSEISDWQPEILRLKTEREQLGYVRRSRRSQENQSQRMQLNALSESLPTQWEVPVLDVYFGLKHGDIRIDHNGALVITTLNETLAQNLRNADMVGTLDATLTPKMLAFYRGRDVSEILHIRKQSAPTPNLTVKHIEGLGNCGGGKQSESRIERKKQVYEAVVKQHGCKPVTFDHKAHTPIWKALGVELDGHWRGEKTRGSNDFEQANVFLMFGGPRENLSSAQARYNVLAKWNRAQGLPVMPFEEFYDTETNAEILQAVGRARAVQRPNVPITVYIVWDDEQSKREQRCELPAALHAETISVDDFAPAAAAADSKTLLKLSLAVAEGLRRTGQAPTQAELAATAGYSQGYISKFFTAHFGSWRRGLEIFLALLKPSNRARNNLIRFYDPPLLQSILVSFQTLATAPFRELQRQIISLYADLEGRPGLFAAFCGMLPESLRLNLVNRLCGTELEAEPEAEPEASPEAVPELDPPAAMPVEPEPVCAPPDPPATVAEPAAVTEMAAVPLASTVVRLPRVNDVVSLNQDGQRVAAVVTAVPVEHRDPKRRRQFWLARLEDGHERHVWHVHEFLTIATSP